MKLSVSKGEYSWEFPSNNYGQIFGIADSGVETFKGTSMKSLTREICQNSIDANMDDTMPTHIQFKTFEVAPNKIPGFLVLQDSFERSLDFWSKQQSEKAKTFFKNAIDVSKQSKILCLRISDFNTTGLLGSDEEYNSPWCNLTKSQGASDKSGANGGSFGIGKFAPYACSAFRTVFYSTRDSTGVEAYQGVARLTSFKNEKNEITQGTGFYGGRKNSPIQHQYSLDSDYTCRTIKKSGTDLYVLGFKGDDGWKHEMVKSVLDGFLYAIYTGKLIVEVEDVIIDKDSLPELMNAYKFEENADEYYKTLVADKKLSPLYEEEIDDLGKVALRLMIQPEYHRKVAMVRKTGMKIMDKGNINGLIPFAGVLFIEGNELNKFLRELENPQHTKWQIERAENKSRVKIILALLTRFIKKCLDKLKNDDSEESLDASVGEYLAIEENSENLPENKGENINDNIRDIQAKTVTCSQKTGDMGQPGAGMTEIDDENGNIIVDDIPGEGGRSSMSNGGTAHGGMHGHGKCGGDTPIEHRKSLVSIIEAKTRVICMNKSNGEYSVSITPTISAKNGFIDLFMSAESHNYNAEILSVTCPEMPDLQINENRIKNLSFTSNKLLRITISINYHDYCSMEVKAYGHKI